MSTHAVVNRTQDQTLCGLAYPPDGDSRAKVEDGEMPTCEVCRTGYRDLMRKAIDQANRNDEVAAVAAGQLTPTRIDIILEDYIGSDPPAPIAAVFRLAKEAAILRPVAVRDVEEDRVYQNVNVVVAMNAYGEPRLCVPRPGVDLDSTWTPSDELALTSFVLPVKLPKNRREREVLLRHALVESRDGFGRKFAKPLCGHEGYILGADSPEDINCPDCRKEFEAQCRSAGGTPPTWLGDV